MKQQWQKAEDMAQIHLEKEFEKTFKPHIKIKIGEVEREFDWVSDDGKIVAQVKLAKVTKKSRNTRFKRDFLYDCLTLDKAAAKRKIFFMATEKSHYEDFKKWSKGLMSEEVEIRHLSIK